MMLKTSSNKVNPYSNMFRYTFRRNLGIIALVVIAFLLICPSYMLINIGDYAVGFSERKAYFNGWATGFSMFCGIISGISAVGINLLNFSFMFKRNSSDFIDSLPITRTELFVSRVFSGYLLVLIPSVISLLALGISSAFFGYPALFVTILVNILHIAVVTAVCSAISMLFIVASANVFDFLVSFIGINLGLIVLGLILCTMFEQLLLGYSSGDSTWAVLKAISPFFFTFYGFGEHLYEEGMPLISVGFTVKNIVMILLFFAVSALLYKKRKSESTGKAFAYKFLYVICAFLASTCSCYAVGTIFAGDTDFKSPLFYVFGLIGALIAGIIYGAITFRGFKTIKKSLVIGLVSFVFIIVSVVAIKLDFVGFSKKIPKKEDIKDVYIESNAIGIRYSGADADFVLKLHSKIISNEGVALGYYDDHGIDSSYINIKYSLKNGKEFKRNYEVRTSKIQSELTEMLKSEERFNSVKETLIKSKAKTVSFYSYGKEGNSLCDTYLTYDEALKFIEVYKNELKTKNVILPNYGSTFYQISFGLGSHYESFDFSYNDSFAKTKEYLDSLKLEDRVNLYNTEDDVIEYKPYAVS